LYPMTRRAPQRGTPAGHDEDLEEVVPRAAPAGDEPGPQALRVDPDANGLRLDRYLAGQIAGVSRSRIQRWIEAGAVRRNGEAVRARDSVYEGDRIEVVPVAEPAHAAFRPEPMALPIVFEDEYILVIDKPAGLVVHPGAGNWTGTLLNGLLAHDPRLAAVPRAGIVHRLDAGTSGLMVVARSSSVQLELVRQLQARTVVREYWALVAGVIAPSLTIDAALGRDPRNAVRFRVSRALSARPARTYVRRLAQWRPAGMDGTISWIVCRLDTGRTHQIRVHLESVGNPLIGDPLYRRHMPAAFLGDGLLARQALHACRLELEHPGAGGHMGWSSAPPPDMLGLMRRLGATAAQVRPPARLSIALQRPEQEAPLPAEDAEDYE